MEEHKKHRRRHRIQGAMILVAIQVIAGFFFARGLKANYHKRTGNESIKEGSIYDILNTKNTTPKTSHEAAIFATGTEFTGEENQYKSVFGNIEVTTTKTQEENENLIYEVTDAVHINTEKMYIYFLLKDAVNQGILDKGILDYCLTQEDLNIETTLADLSFLVPGLSYDAQVANTKTTEIIDNIKKTDKAGIKTILESINTEYLSMTDSSNTMENLFAFTSTDAFSYVRNQLVVDEPGKYSETIKEASQLFDVDEDIIRAVIFTEQLRGMTTYRGIFKSLIAGNKYLMIMSQFSYGLGGMKEKAAIETEDWHKANNEEVYNQVFTYEDEKYIATERIQRLTSTEDYRYQIMYIAGLLSMYKEQRKNAGYDISDKIGIITTLYNIGYKEPNEQAEIGGANIRTKGESLSFGKMSLAIFYMIKANK